MYIVSIPFMLHNTVLSQNARIRLMELTVTRPVTVLLDHVIM